MTYRGAANCCICGAKFYSKSTNGGLVFCAECRHALSHYSSACTNCTELTRCRKLTALGADQPCDTPGFKKQPSMPFAWGMWSEILKLEMTTT